MQPGWNLGNTYDAIPDETSWGNPPVTQALFRKIKSEGYRSIRLPIAWGIHQGGAPAYTIDPAWMAKVRKVVDLALAEDLYVMLNMHHDSWMWVNNLSADHDTVLARYEATWTQIAAEFRDDPSRLVFESINEPTFGNTPGDDENYRLLAELNRVFHRIVRESGGGNDNRLLVLPTLYTNSEQGRLDAPAAELTALRDPMVATTIHFYGWWPFSVNIAGYTRDAASEQDLSSRFDRAYNTFVAHDIPVIIGEYALLAHDHNRPGIIQRGEVHKYFEYVGYYARQRKFTTMLWDAGQFLNRNTLQWREPEPAAQIRSGWTTRSGTASSYLLFLPKSGYLTSRTLTLNPNGTDFQGLRHGSRNLLKGRDYTVSGNQLTLTPAALTQLAGDRQYGLNATLEAGSPEASPGGSTSSRTTPRSCRTPPGAPAAWPSPPSSGVTSWRPWRPSTTTAAMPARPTGPRTSSGTPPSRRTPATPQADLRVLQLGQGRLPGDAHLPLLERRPGEVPRHQDGHLSDRHDRLSSAARPAHGRAAPRPRQAFSGSS